MENYCTTKIEFLCAKIALTSTSYSKNDTILKMAEIDHDAKALGFAKCSVWVKN